MHQTQISLAIMQEKMSRSYSAEHQAHYLKKKRKYICIFNINTKYISTITKSENSKQSFHVNELTIFFYVQHGEIYLHRLW